MEISLFAISFLIVLGLLAGMVASICGIGGGIMWVSLMTIVLSIPIKIAIDTSTFVILISSAVAFIMFYKNGRLNLKQVLIFACFSILGGLCCSVLLIFVVIDSTILKFIFASTLLIAGGNMIYKALKSRRNPNIQTSEEVEFSLSDYDYRTNLVKAIPLFFSAGFFAYLIGIGGGIINTPSLHIILGYPIHNATAISTGIIFFTSVFNTILKTFLGQIDFVIGLFISIGCVSGSFLGVKVSNKIPKAFLQSIVAGVLILFAIMMFF